MSYRVSVHDSTTTTVHLKTDRLDIHNSPALKLELKRLLEGRSTTVIVDFTTVHFVDSSGLGALLAAVRVASRNGGQIRVAGLCPDVRATFELARLNRVFDIFPTEREARAS
jgi:anti-sigma B factor antagonist